MSARTHRRARAFTLIEVMVALVIVAMSVGALLGTITSAYSNISYLHDKTLAEWVALDRLTEIRIAQQLPDKGKRAGNTTMGGLRWQWEQEVVELPVKGMWRIDVRARMTGETVDDSRDVQKNTTQKEPDSSPSGGDLANVSWLATVTGGVSSARSDRLQPIGAACSGNLQAGGPNNPAPNTPGAPGTVTPVTPGSPYKPGSPTPPANPPATDR